MNRPKTVNRGWPPDLRPCPVLQGPGPKCQTVETSAFHGCLRLAAVWDDKRNWHYLCHRFCHSSDTGNAVTWPSAFPGRVFVSVNQRFLASAQTATCSHSEKKI